MEQIKKFGLVEKSAAAPDMEAINRLTLEPLTEEEVFTFRLAASNDQPDRDLERFTVRSLRDMARLYVGKTVLMDHVWSAEMQKARVYAAEVETGADGVTRLLLDCYMLRSAENRPLTDAIRGGILREVSVGCAVVDILCGICGTNPLEKRCEHIRGKVYDGKLCVWDLDGVSDVYEVSFCAVPANAGAGTTKAARPAEAAEENAFSALLAELHLVYT